MVKTGRIAHWHRQVLGKLMGALALVIFAVVAFSSPAEAMTKIALTNVEANPCPAEMAEGSVTSDGSGRPADCYLISGVATNTTNKIVYDADVFGRVYDNSHNSVMENRTRLGMIPEVPPGKSDFSIRISVPASLEPPLILEQFRSSGFGASVRFSLPGGDFDNDFEEDEDF
jgi:hypothetical protein